MSELVMPEKITLYKIALYGVGTLLSFVPPTEGANCPYVEGEYVLVEKKKENPEYYGVGC